MRRAKLSIVVVLLLTGSALHRDARAEGPNRLVGGKLMYVGPMPQDLDSWIVEDLRIWGKYKPTRQSEGADLVIKVDKPEEKVEYKLKQGVPQPKTVQPKKGGKPFLFSISVDDWITGKSLWSADVFNVKPKDRSAGSPPGSHAEIDAKGLSSEQMATAIIRAFRSYVERLARESAPQPNSTPPH